MRWVGEANSHGSRQDPCLQRETHKRENNYNCRYSPKELGVWALHWAPQPGGPTRGMWAPRTFDSEGQQQGLLFGSCSGLWKIETSLWKDAHNISYAPELGRNSNLKGAWVRPNCWSWRALPWGHRHWHQPLWGAPATTWTRVQAGAICNLPLAY